MPRKLFLRPFHRLTPPPATGREEPPPHRQDTNPLKRNRGGSAFPRRSDYQKCLYSAPRRPIPTACPKANIPPPCRRHNPRHGAAILPAGLRRTLRQTEIPGAPACSKRIAGTPGTTVQSCRGPTRQACRQARTRRAPCCRRKGTGTCRRTGRGGRPRKFARTPTRRCRSGMPSASCRTVRI